MHIFILQPNFLGMYEMINIYETVINNASSASNNNLLGLFKSSFDQMHFLFKRSIDICEKYFRMRISKKRVLDSFFNKLSFSIDPQFTFDLSFH